MRAKREIKCWDYMQTRVCLHKHEGFKLHLPRDFPFYCCLCLRFQPQQQSFTSCLCIRKGSAWGLSPLTRHPDHQPVGFYIQHHYYYRLLFLTCILIGGLLVIPEELVISSAILLKYLQIHAHHHPCVDRLRSRHSLDLQSPDPMCIRITGRTNKQK